MQQYTLLSIGEAAKVLGVSIDTLRRWANTGKIRTYREKGNYRYFRVSDLESYSYNRRLTTSQAAQVLGVSSSSLRRMEPSGLLIPERGSNRWRQYKHEDLYKFMRLRDKTFIQAVAGDSSSLRPDFVALQKLFK
jgi:excisionase family DNA binding protein